MTTTNKLDKVQRMTMAIENYMQGYNCAQAIALTFADVYNLDSELALRISSSFGCGIARMGEVCGAASAMFMLAGLECGTTQPTDVAGRKLNFDTVRMLADKFKAMHHDTMICREILQKSKGDTPIAPTPQIAEYYAKRPCTYRVGSAAEIFCDYLNSKDSE